MLSKSWKRLIQSLVRNPSTRRRGRLGRRRMRPEAALVAEHLEDRTLLATFTVNSFVDLPDSTPGDGLADASTNGSGLVTLRAAIMEANALQGADTIELPAGQYQLYIEGNLEDAAATGDLDITESLTINGAGAGSTFVDGGRLDRVFDIRGPHVSQQFVLITGITIQGGKAPDVGGGREHNGGGLRNLSSRLEIHDSAIRFNETGSGFRGGRGGGLYTESGDVRIENSTIRKNITADNPDNGGIGGFGGGLAGLDSAIVINGSLITENATGNGRQGSGVATAGRGGGIHTDTGTLTISNSTISNNRTGSSTPSDLNRLGLGGGINFTDRLILHESIVTGNTAYNGGGIMVGSGNGVVERISLSTISNNTSTGGEGGGGIHNEGGTIQLISGTTISGNRALNTTGSLSGGGGIFSQGDIGIIVNTTISGNSTDGVGGGIANQDDIGLILNATIADNTARNGGGIYHTLFANATPTIDRLFNTIIADNVNPGGGQNDFLIDGALNTARHNLVETIPGGSTVIQDGTNGNRVGLDPRLDVLKDNGGLTLTHGLFRRSPAINGGDNAVAPAVDQRGVRRPIGRFVDIGAFEGEILPPNVPPVADPQTVNLDEDTTHDGQLTGSDADGDVLTFQLLSGPTNHFGFTFLSSGSFSYTPKANFNGTDSFTFRAYDGIDFSDPATVTINVRPVNDAPVADDNTFRMPENSPNGHIVGTVDASDVDGDVLTFEIVGGNDAGAFSIDAGSGQITVADTTQLDFETTPRFDFIVRVSDPDGLFDDAAVTIHLTDVPETISPPIDIRPGDESNTINIKSNGHIEVALLSTDSFDALSVDVNSLTFGQTGYEDSLSRNPSNGKPRFKIVDINGDGRLDIVVRFEIEDTGFQVGDTLGHLRGRTIDGLLIESSQYVMIRKPGKKK